MDKRQIKSRGEFYYADASVAANGFILINFSAGDYKAMGVAVQKAKRILLDSEGKIDEATAQYVPVTEGQFDNAKISVKMPDGKKREFAVATGDLSAVYLEDLMAGGVVPESPSTVETIADVKIADHVAEADPHTQYILESERSSANGVAALDGSATIPDNQIPSSIARDSELSPKMNKSANLSDVTDTAAAVINLGLNLGITRAYQFNGKNTNSATYDLLNEDGSEYFIHDIYFGLALFGSVNGSFSITTTADFLTAIPWNSLTNIGDAFERLNISGGKPFSTQGRLRITSTSTTNKSYNVVIIATRFV